MQNTNEIPTLALNVEEVETLHSVPQNPLDEALPLEQVKAQVQLIQRVMQGVMKKDEHYGVIPGSSKPVLYKAGAEKLAMTFRLAPKYEITRYDLPNGHREYEVICHIYSIISGKFLGSGTGNCSTLESKYRYRSGPIEPTGRQVPRKYWDLRKTNPEAAQKVIGGLGYAVKKINGRWEIVRKGERIENPDPADCWNTVKKMAKKRAFVDAILTVTAASDIFTQDIEDESSPPEADPPQPQPQTEAPKESVSERGEDDIPF
ncbi:hypothetical protein DBT_1439 [Dissulfuribacter thermophilus]|uniref:Uncharacterized protein n=1 Tax=Dissulfuribacter thermophilus TaxID=1156395 RepID=A0A1B9F5W4_9BACT|nr:hypothetical protein [Dissulfuribacter thermophilus]OCC15316.1 hypothetical protein DBT_1439 [Dissulfuribacter thermophilus]